MADGIGQGSGLQCWECGRALAKAPMAACVAVVKG